MQEDSELIEKAVQNVLLKGLRTADIKDGAKWNENPSRKWNHCTVV